MDHATTKPPAILQVMSHNELGGVKVLAAMVGDGLVQRGCAVDTVFLSAGTGTKDTIRNLADIMQRIRSGQYPIIFGYHAAASLYSTLLGFLFRTPARIVHQTAPPEDVRPHWRVLDKAFGALGIYTHIISNSDATTATFATWPGSYRDRIKLIYHGVSDLPEAPARNWRQELGIPADAFVIVTTGRLTDQKNQDVVVRALPKLPNVRFVVAGEGENRARLTALARDLKVEDRLHLIGALPRAELRGLLLTADVFAFPSAWETFGLSGVEAAMLGMPIVAADLPVLREVLDVLPAHPDERKAVLFHPIHDDAAFAACIAQFRDKPRRKDDLQAFAAAHRDRYGYERMIDDYVRLIDGLSLPRSGTVR
jgi:glycosyltransferase involved in cell wall biosynthesis